MGRRDMNLEHIKMLYVHASSVVYDMMDALRSLGYYVEEYPQRISGFLVEEAVIEDIINYIKANGITHIFSINLVDNLAIATERLDGRVKYVSVIWDAPYYKLLSRYGTIDSCYFSVFDQTDYARCIERKVPHVLYQPLSVGRELVTRFIKETSRDAQFLNEVCFVGNLYDNNLYDEYVTKAPQMLQDFFVAIFEESAFKWDGTDRIHGKVSKETFEYLKKHTPNFELINLFEIEDLEYFETYYLMRKVANIERVILLNMLAEMFSVTLYTASKTAKQQLKNIKIMPPVEGGITASTVFAQSRINLNITLKGIERGTPQRVMDIMGVGGFCLSSYSPETAELFEEDKEIVMFKTPDELAKKIEYYLVHEAERKEIAEAGCRKVLQCYTSEEKCRKLMDWVEGEEINR